MPGIDLINAAIFVGAALILIGMLSSLVATRFGAPLLLVFLISRADGVPRDNGCSDQFVTQCTVIII